MNANSVIIFLFKTRIKRYRFWYKKFVWCRNIIGGWYFHWTINIKKIHILLTFWINFQKKNIKIITIFIKHLRLSNLTPDIFNIQQPNFSDTSFFRFPNGHLSIQNRKCLSNIREHIKPCTCVIFFWFFFSGYFHFHK